MIREGNVGADELRVEEGAMLVGDLVAACGAEDFSGVDHAAAKVMASNEVPMPGSPSSRVSLPRNAFVPEPLDGLDW